MFWIRSDQMDKTESSEQYLTYLVWPSSRGQVWSKNMNSETSFDIDEVTYLNRTHLGSKRKNTSGFFTCQSYTEKWGPVNYLSSNVFLEILKAYCKSATWLHITVCSAVRQTMLHLFEYCKQQRPSLCTGQMMIPFYNFIWPQAFFFFSFLFVFIPATYMPGWMDGSGKQLKNKKI